MITERLADYASCPDGSPRHIGVEIEYSGVPLDRSAQTVQSLFGGEITSISRHQKKVINTEYGDFTLELDASLLKKMEDKETSPISTIMGNLSAELDDLLSNVAEKFVPYEIAAPPIPISELDSINRLISHLRLQGALGTTHALHYAFGVHLNIEPPEKDTQTVLSFFRVFLILQAWIERQSELDLTRQISPFINDYPSSCLKLMMDSDYAPDQSQFTQDYIEHNPTRNRAIDMLPILAYWDEATVRDALPDEKISPRPAFHYRLPNSKIDLLS